MEGTAILESLANARWHVARRTYGNSHASLIGLLVGWWISQDPVHHSALEGGPWFREDDGEAKACDALLCRDDAPIGVLEVEGLRQERTARKFATYFATDARFHPRFGLLLLYRTKPEGRGRNREYPQSASAEALEIVASISSRHPSKDIVVVAMEKACSTPPVDLGPREGYYCGVVTKIGASLYRGGKVIAERTYN